MHVRRSKSAAFRGVAFSGVVVLCAAFAAALSLTSWPCAAAPLAPADAQGADAGALDRPASHAAVLAQSAQEDRVVVALFSLAGCAWCDALRADHLRHLAREADARRLRVVEYDIGDRHPFAAASVAKTAHGAAAGHGVAKEHGVAKGHEVAKGRDAAKARDAVKRDDAAKAPASPAALAGALQVRVAPTLVFLGPDGSEIAERLVGYPSPDFYGAYLEQRITKAHERLSARH